AFVAGGEILWHDEPRFAVSLAQTGLPRSGAWTGFAPLVFRPRRQPEPRPGGRRMSQARVQRPLVPTFHSRAVGPRRGRRLRHVRPRSTRRDGAPADPALLRPHRLWHDEPVGFLATRPRPRRRLVCLPRVALG